MLLKNLKEKFVLLLLAIALTTGLDAQPDYSFAVQANTENGTIEGLYDTKSNLQLFLGIPYAKPPVGELRWKAPQKPDNWTGVKKTVKFGPRAMQPPLYSDMVFRSDGISEDCLYLNVWTPAKRGETALPVLVYFYGGGFSAGDGSECRYDGAKMAQQGIVVVTVNYRLNIFGFLAHPELSAEAPYKASGNYGLLDQAAALQWVTRNIAAFGGNPKQLTIAGESAGSISVSMQMASPLSKGLIAGAIGQSGAAIHPTFPPVPLAEAEQQGLEFAKAAGNLTLKQLRALSARDIYEIYQNAESKRFSTVIDGYFFTKSLIEVFRNSEQAQVPLLLGWNSAEIPAAAFMHGLPFTPENYETKLKEVFSEAYAEALLHYPDGSAKNIEISATALASDRFIAYSTWKWGNLHSQYSKQPVYRYLYSKLRPPLKGQQNANNVALAIGAPHACEIEYCLGNLHLINEYEWTADDYKVSETMLGYFANFIKTGNPNASGLPNWDAVGNNFEAPPVMIIDTRSEQINAVNDNRYKFLDKFYGNDK